VKNNILIDRLHKENQKMKNRKEIETEKNSPFMAKAFKKELPQIREWLKTSPCGYEEILLKSGQLCVSFDLEDLYKE